MMVISGTEDTGCVYKKGHHIMGDDSWRFEKSWPLPDTDFPKYYFDSEKGANSLNGDGI